MSYVRKAVCFNVDNNHQRELFEWVTSMCGDNFSGYAKALFYAEMINARNANNRQDGRILTVNEGEDLR
ncbi:hypothetical protein [Paenibacillus xanthanilyticus]|uniref:Uncharacterized protein n=1 Tax=Paenibacillus xanthanilyticus TaxID=1783531 RepID=A0ABV8KC45_9BACL